MFFITGDTHGDFTRLNDFYKKVSPTRDDVFIILGDAGFNYFGDERDNNKKEFVSTFPFVTFCIHGNHEMRPEDIPGYVTREFCGGNVWYQDAYPNILFAKDGEVYDFGGLSCIAIGGAYSVDKFERLEKGWHWFENEQPSDEIKSFVEEKLALLGDKIDIVLSHTCPLKYEPREAFSCCVDQRMVDKSTEVWLDTLEDRIEYKRWYCGHFHIDKVFAGMRFMFTDIEELHD